MEIASVLDVVAAPFAGFAASSVWQDDNRVLLSPIHYLSLEAGKSACSYHGRSTYFTSLLDRRLVVQLLISYTEYLYTSYTPGGFFCVVVRSRMHSSSKVLFSSMPVMRIDRSQSPSKSPTDVD